MMVTGILKYFTSLRIFLKYAKEKYYSDYFRTHYFYFYLLLLSLIIEQIYMAHDGHLSLEKLKIIYIAFL